VDKGSEEISTTERIIRAWSFMHLIAPAAVLGPNHCPASLQSSYQTRAIRHILNRQSEDGKSKDQIRSWTYVEQSAVCTGWDVRAAANYEESETLMKVKGTRTSSLGKIYQHSSKK
jgi:hypothetical protein